MFKDRFFAGIPKVAKAKKESMAIYLLFIQHIMHSLSENGKAAIVVPTGFITAQSGIEKKIREKLVKQGWLRGVVSMPAPGLMCRCSFWIKEQIAKSY
jgi:type I restriction enzyme M protein